MDNSQLPLWVMRFQWLQLVSNMVLLLNLVGLLFLLGVGYSLYKVWTSKKSNFEKSNTTLVICIGTAVLIGVYQAALPSYLPKGEVKRSEVPQFEQKELQVKDVVPKPMEGELRDQRRKELYKESLPFVEKDIDNKE
jgi:hypothetical protein